MKAISPVVSVIILIMIVFSLAAFVIPWVTTQITNTTARLEQQSRTQVSCWNAQIALLEAKYNCSSKKFISTIENRGWVDIDWLLFEVEYTNYTIIDIEPEPNEGLQTGEIKTYNATIDYSEDGKIKEIKVITNCVNVIDFVTCKEIELVDCTGSIC